MKLSQCDWVPTSVVDWLCRELDDRGIPGTTYTHTLLSLLHPYFCPHPVPRKPGHPPKDFINSECIRSILNSRQLPELQVLFEELEEHVHPDADFPELNISETIKEGTRRAKKRQKRRLQQLSFSPERIWKVAALQCLLSASDEHHNFENVIDELFQRLASCKADFADNSKAGRSYLLEKKGTDRDEDATKQEGIEFDSVKLTLLESCYSSNFPPLSIPKHDNELIVDETGNILNWKSLIKDKLSPKKNEKFETIEECNPLSREVLKDISNTLLNHCVKNEILAMEVSPNSVENGGLERKAYFIPIFREEERLLNSEINHQKNAVENGGGSFQVINPVVQEKGKLEEWECTGNLVAGPVNRAISVDLMGNRLYERSTGSADTTRCNSNSDLAICYSQSDDATSSGPVWGYASESGKDQPTETVWNASPCVSQPYTDKNEARLDQVTSIHPLCIPDNDDTTAEGANEFEYVQAKNDLIDSWPPNQNWTSLVSNDEKSDPIFSSAFRCSPHTALKGAREDCIISIPEMCNENLKNIWSDFNDNITTLDSGPEAENLEAKPESPSDVSYFEPADFDEKETEEKLCESFKKLGLELLWEDQLKIDNYMAEESLIPKSFVNSSINVFDDPGEHLSEQTLNSQETFRMKCAQKEEIEDNLLLHKIPSGPSGPHVEFRQRETSGFRAVIPNKSTQVSHEGTSCQDGSMSITPKGFSGPSLDRNLTTQEEENLLTSPRTHFRPIRQDSHGSIDEPKLEDGQSGTNGTNIQDPDFVFQRSGSGTLYLESDLLKGSPKKYMAYREPPAKASCITNTTEAIESLIVSQPTEVPQVSFVPKFKLINNEKFCQTERPDGTVILRESLGKKQTKILQKEINKYNYIYKQPPEQMWDTNSYPNNIKMLWEDKPKLKSEEAWELELATQPLPYPKWSTHDFDQADWSNNPAKQQQNIQEPINKQIIFKESNSSKEDAFSKIKFIWHNSAANSSSHSLVNTSRDFLPSMNSFSENWAEKKLPLDPALQSETPSLVSSLVVPKRSPWTIDVELQKQDKSEETTKKEKPIDLPSRWQLQWEVDQEADEILGGLFPSSPLKSSPPYESPLKNAGTNCEADEFKFLDFLEGQDQQPPLEDLDHLEPGWDLNEGFEWGPDTEEIFQCDDDDSGREIYVYENEDGQTVMLPVEYLEDSLYDQIFGSVDTPIGGSLPDLPGGQMTELKKGSLSYKLSRRSRGDRFVPPSRRPCSFFLEGNCRRSDCKFSHDLITITCRFWEEGSCLKGETCPFRHGFPPPPPPRSRRRNRSEGDQTSLVEPVSFASLKEGSNASTGSKGRPIPRKQKGGSVASISSFELDSEADFPCLGSSVESKMDSLDDMSYPPNVRVTRVSKKKKKYTAITKNLLETDSGNGWGLWKGPPIRYSKGCRARSNDLLPHAAADGRVVGGGVEEPGGGRGTGGPCSSSRKKKKGRDHGGNKECVSLRKVLRKRFSTNDHQSTFSYEDGTFSDY